jgi:hypothetical protein
VVAQTVLGTQDHGQLGASVELRGANVRVVQFFQAGEVHVGRCGPMHFRSLEHHSRCGLLAHLACLTKKRPQLVAHVEVAEPVDAEVSVDAIVVCAVLVGVDACGEHEEVEAIQRVADLGEHVLNFAQVAHVAVLPLDLRISLLFLDGLDGIGSLLFFAVYHDDLDASKGECTADFIAAVC